MAIEKMKKLRLLAMSADRQGPPEGGFVLGGGGGRAPPEREPPAAVPH